MSELIESVQVRVALPAPWDARRWYAVHTRSNFEKIVSGELDLRGLERFLPAVRELHRWKDRRKEVEIPVFPGYVFVRMEDTPPRRLQVLRINGAVRILGSAGAIEPVPDTEIESLQRLVRSKAAFFAHPFLREGARVRVRWGPLQGVEGRLVRIKSASRLVLSVDMLSQAVATEIDAGDVEVISRSGSGSRRS